MDDGILEICDATGSAEGAFLLAPLGGGGGGEKDLYVDDKQSAGSDDVSFSAGADVAIGVAAELFECTLLAGGGGGFRPIELDLLIFPGGPAAIEGGDSVPRLVESFLDSGGDGGSGFFSTDGDGTLAGVGDLSPTEDTTEGDCPLSK